MNQQIQLTRNNNFCRTRHLITQKIAANIIFRMPVEIALKKTFRYLTYYVKNVDYFWSIYCVYVWKIWRNIFYLLDFWGKTMKLYIQNMDSMYVVRVQIFELLRNDLKFINTCGVWEFANGISKRIIFFLYNCWRWRNKMMYIFHFWTYLFVCLSTVNSIEALKWKGRDDTHFCLYLS